MDAKDAIYVHMQLGIDVPVLDFYSISKWTAKL